MKGDCLLIRSCTSPTVMTVESTWATTCPSSPVCCAGLAFSVLQAGIMRSAGMEIARPIRGIRMRERLHSFRAAAMRLAASDPARSRADQRLVGVRVQHDVEDAVDDRDH